MLGLGMASAHAPMMFQKAQYWPRVVERIPAQAREHLPHSARVEIGSPAVVEGYVRRPATVVDYVPAHCTQTGCGFVYWPAVA